MNGSASGYDEGITSARFAAEGVVILLSLPLRGPGRSTDACDPVSQNDTSSPIVGSVGNMLIPERVGGELS